MVVGIEKRETLEKVRFVTLLGQDLPDVQKTIHFHRIKNEHQGPEEKIRLEYQPSGHFNFERFLTIFCLIQSTLGLGMLSKSYFLKILGHVHFGVIFQKR